MKASLFTHNATAAERESKESKREEAKKESKRAELRRQLRALDKEDERIRLDQEQDPEVLANLEDGNHPAVKHYSDLLTKVDRKRTAVLAKLNSLQ